MILTSATFAVIATAIGSQKEWHDPCHRKVPADIQYDRAVR
jgi:hypothetical protein